MEDLPERLTAQLQGRYQILREVGRGGMATVYLAKDLRHPRQVAMKVFRPELAASGGVDRFVREIEMISRLSHPNILSLFDSGEVDGVPFYVMPFVEGESVAARIEREGPLPIADALLITRQVAAALHYAHQQGVVHRDIKPDNILLAGDTALLADFGIAQAVETLGSQRLTATGLAVGTPAFMSPEQIPGSVKLDGRADIYSLGCVLYTMLLGEPPFTGASMQAVLARHLAEPVPGLRVVRATIPRAVEAATQRALAKAPVDRFADAAAFGEALSPEHLSDDSLATIMRSPRRGRRTVLALATAVAVVAAAVWIIRPWTLTRRSGADSALSTAVVAVAPFSLEGSAESALGPSFSRIGPLLAERLPGDGGPRGVALDTTAIGDLRTNLRSARAVGAGLLIRGSVALSGDHVAIDATLRSVANDSILSSVDDLTAPRDSLHALLDLVAARLLIGRMRESPEHSNALGRLGLATLRQYLGARDHLRRGQLIEARAGFESVLAADPTAYPAALDLASVHLLRLSISESRGPLAQARTQIDRMSPGDTARMRSLQMWRDDDTTRALSADERLLRLEKAATADPNGAIQRFLLGERLLHDGPLIGVRDMLRLAGGSFERVLELEPDFLPALRHAIDLAAARGDTALVRAHSLEYFAIDSSGVAPGYYRWRVAVALGDRKGLEQIRAGLDTLPKETLERIVNISQLDGLSLVDALRASRTLWSRSSASGEARWAFVKQRELALNRGRPAEAQAILEQWLATSTPFRARDGVAEVVNALFWGADTVVPSEWVAQSATAVMPTVAQSDRTQWEPIFLPWCAVGLWHAARGEPAIAGRTVPVLGQGASHGDEVDNTGLCAAIIEARLAAKSQAPEAGALLMRLDSLAAAAPSVITWMLAAANITASELWEAAGDVPKALTAARRRVHVTDMEEQRVIVALSTMHRMEGRLAALAGDTTGAILAYRRYLGLRDDPEPAMLAEVQSVRTALAQLEAP
jgi:serine/threonine protein kinase/tetratricopeptide (TPR) repeat protein